jgi:hypothetical protein
VRRQYELTQQKNPHALTIRQHVYPSKGISRFCNPNGKRERVQIFDKTRQKSRPAAPDDAIFCGKRVWDQRAESGYMKDIEDAFQALACQVINGFVTDIDEEQKKTVDAFFALWRMRADYRCSQSTEISLNAVTGGDWTQDQEERFESCGVLFVRSGGKLPARMLYGLRIQSGIDDYVDQLASVRWGILKAVEGHLVVPDFPAYMIIPLTPTLCLCSGGRSGILDPSSLLEINRGFRATSVEYFFAQDLDRCP